MEVVSHTIVSLTTFVLAVYVGYHVVWNVTPALHTPLMAVTNAISAIVIVGAMLAAALTETVPGKVIGVLAVALAAVNVFGASWSRAGCWRCSGRRTRSLRLRTGVPSESAFHQPGRGDPAVPGGQRVLHPGLKGLSHPTTSIRGNRFGMAGMTIAVLTTGALILKLSAGNVLGLGYVLLGLVIGGGIGAFMARRVEMTKMPELVAFMHSMIGLAAVFIAMAAVGEPYAFGIAAKGAPIPTGNRLELFLGRRLARSRSRDRSSPSASSPAGTSSACSKARRCGSRASTCSTSSWAWRPSVWASPSWPPKTGPPLARCSRWPS